MVIGLIQAYFHEGRLSEECACQIAILIPKGEGNFHRTGLVKFLWKTVTGILNRRLAEAIQFHDTLHGFCTVKGTGNASLEADLLQQLMDMSEEALYDILLDLHKAYESLY